MFRTSRIDPSEPKAAPKRLRLWMTAVSLIAASVLTVAIVLGVQNHDDHALTAQIVQAEGELRTFGARIASIKDHEFRTMGEYVAAYAQIEPLLTEYDRKLQEYSDLCNTAQQRDQKLGLIKCPAFAPPLQPRSVAQHIGNHRADSPDQRNH